MPTKEEIDIKIMELWDEIFELEDKLGEELDIKDAVVMHIESMKGISEESMLIYKEVKTVKDKYKQEMVEKHAKIETLNKEKKMV